MAVGPLLAGLFAGDVDRLSVQATFPELAAVGGHAGQPDPRCTGGAASPRRGSGRADVPPAARAAPTGSRPPSRRRWVRGADGGTGRHAPRAAAGRGRCSRGRRAGRRRRGRGHAPRRTSPGTCWSRSPARRRPISRASRAASTAVLLMVYAEGPRRPLPDGTGFVTPRGRTPMTAATFLSTKWPRPRVRHPGGRSVLRRSVRATRTCSTPPTTTSSPPCARHLAAVVALPDRPEHAAVVRWPSLDAAVRARTHPAGGSDPRALAAGYLRDGTALRRRGGARLRPAASETADAVQRASRRQTTPRSTSHERHGLRASTPSSRPRPELRALLADAEDRARRGARDRGPLQVVGRHDRRSRHLLDGRVPPDADVVLWLVAPSPEETQRAFIEFRRTEVGRLLDLVVDLHGRGEAGRVHRRPFARLPERRTARPYLCVYPFVRTPEWYVLPREERAELLPSTA